MHEGYGTRQPNHGPSLWKAPEIYRKRLKKRQAILDCNEKTSTESASAFTPTGDPLFTTSVDIFSFAMIAWELFHLGQFPWAGELNLVCFIWEYQTSPHLRSRNF